MLSAEILDDLQSYNLPILAIGDPGQLEPISDRDINLMETPDITLDKIHRQALTSPIIDLATRIRLDQEWDYQDDSEDCIVDSLDGFQDSIPWADIIICGFNKTRVSANQDKRQHLGYSKIIEEGDTLLCLQNDKQLGVFNGLTFTVQRIRRTYNQFQNLDLLTSDGKTLRNIRTWTGAINEKKPDWKILREFQGNTLVVDYGYAITCHKAQGSEWDKVAIYDEQFPKLWDATRWRYTAITRAAKQLRFFCK